MYETRHWDKPHLKSMLTEHEVTFVDETINHVAPDPATEGLIIFIDSVINKEVLDSLPNLKLICTMSTGFDHVDIEECKSRGIPVCTVPYYGENTVAEYTFALLLALQRKIVETANNTKAGNYDRSKLGGFDLNGKTIGLVGGGHIGLHVIRIAKGFGMKVLVFDVVHHGELAVELGYDYVPMDELLERSDVISLHVPHNKHTHHLLNTAAFEKMKSSCIVINTARGGIVNTAELVEALESGKIGGAGIDAIEAELVMLGKKEADTDEEHELVKLNNKLANLPNVIVTPHNAFHTREALGRIEQTTVDNITAFLRGDTQHNVA